MKILQTLVLLLFAVCAYSQTLWIGATDSDWNNPTNWSAGIPAVGATATILASAPNTPIYGGPTVVNLTIQNFATITFNSTVYNIGSIDNFAGATIVNDGLFVNAGNIFFNNDGNLDNNGTFDNYGTYDHAASAILNIATGASFTSYGLFNSNGQINNDGELSIIGSFSNTNGMDNNGTFNISGTASFPPGSSINNPSGATINITNTGMLDVNGSIPNGGTISNSGIFIVQSASVLTNDGTISNSNEMEIAGNLTNNTNLSNSGTLMINSAGLLENNGTVANSGDMALEICAKLIQNAGNNIDGTIFNDGLVFEINGTVNEVNGDFGDSFTDINDTPDPVPACKGDLILELDENGVVNFTGEDIDRGRSYGSCGGTLVSFDVSPTQFTTADIGIQIVTLTITDNFGKTASCQDFVNVIPLQVPIVAIDDVDIDFSCPENITMSTLPGAQFAEISWTEPTATTTCDPAGSGGGGLGSSSGPDCSLLSNNISGFIYMGELDESKYYCSQGSYNWADAVALAQANGGHLVSINNAAENQFIQDNQIAEQAWLGYSDALTEGNFLWQSAETTTYTNWDTGEPNNYNNSDGSIILKSTGKWRDREVTDAYEVILEVPCPTSCSDNNLSLFLFFDGYAEDVNWTINDENGAAVISGGNYQTQAAGSTVEETICLLDGCYDLVMNGTNCCSYGSGSYFLKDSTGAVLAFGNTANAQDLNNFCLSPSTPPTGGDPELTVTQIGGPLNNSNFPVGTTEVAYEVTDACDNQEVCLFEVTINEVPATFEVTSCPPDVTMNTLPGATSATVSWTDPTGTSDCFRGGPVGVNQTLGLGKGSSFPVGTSTVAYAVFDSCGNFGSCFFDVTVNPVLSTLVISDCPENFNTVAPEGASEATVTWTVPTATTNCFFNSTVTATQLSGPTNGGLFPLGSTEVLYLFADDCSNTQLCSFTVLVNSPCNNNGGDADGDGTCADEDCDDNDPNIPTTPGTLCDDGDSNTANDSYQLDGCTCAGTIIDPCLNNGGDADGDGFCADEDCDDNNAAVPTSPGIACNDGNPDTENDVYQIDGCTCEGALPVLLNVADVSVDEGVGVASVDICLDMPSNLNVQFSYLTSSGTALAAADFGFAIGNPIIPAGDLCTTVAINIVDDTEEEGDEMFTIDLSSPINATIAAVQGNVTILANDVPDPCAANGGDADGDGICADADCNDNDANLPAAVGSTCDDGDATTENDVIGADGCACAGTPIDPCAANGGDADGDGICADADCNDNDANLPAAVGSTCDDGDATTENDVIGADGCACAGTPIDPCAANGGDADGDGICADADCNDNDANLPAAVGSTCDDGDATTENDVIGADGCSCAGTPIDACAANGGDVDGDGICADVDCNDNDANLPAAVGSACDDGDALTENDVIGADGCSCTGTPISTGCNPTYSITGNTLTVNGLNGAHNAISIYAMPTWAGAYSCFDDCTSTIELPDGEYYLHIKVLNASYGIDCQVEEYITINGSAGCIAGTPCDDENACTDNDVMDANCDCAGTAAADADGDGVCVNEDCNDNDANIPAAVGSPCDDGDANTENDVIGSDGCSCAGTPVGACDNNGGDADGDGICADADCNDNDANLPAAIGSTCDDGDALTENDVIGSDGCSCAGTPITTGCNPTYSITGNTLTVNGLNGAHNAISIYSMPTWAGAYSCFDDCVSTIELPDGEYYLHLKVLNASYGIDCQVEEYITINGSAGCTAGTPCDDGDVCTENDVMDANCGCAGTAAADADGDGICVNEDCDDTDASIPAAVGSTCDDGDANTANDVIGADGCSCAGTVVGACDNNGGDADGDGICADVDCNDNDASLPAAIGSTCDDGDANTENDVIGADGCSCAGTPVNTSCNPTYTVIGSTLTVNGLNGEHNSINIYTMPNWAGVFSCFDDCNNPAVITTLADGEYYVHIKVLDAAYQLVCEIQEYITIDGSTGGGCTEGSPCNDGDICTDNDLYDADCNCVGTTTDADGDGVCANEDCNDADASLPMAVGSTCNDGDATTENDVIGADGCTCAGEVPGSCNISVVTGLGSITVSGLDGVNVIVQIFDANWASVLDCLNSCDNPAIVENLVSGTYYVKAMNFDAGWAVTCEEVDYYTVDDGATPLQGEASGYLFLKANKRGAQVNLDWTTNTDFKNDHFVVERSQDGSVFEEIGTKASTSESTLAVSYLDQDVQPLDGANFYRIKQVFEDGSYRYSGIEVVNFDKAFPNFMVYPNPASDRVAVEIGQFLGEEANIQIYNQLGQLMQETNIEELTTSPTVFDLSKYNSGVYAITVTIDNQKRLTKMFVVTKL